MSKRIQRDKFNTPTLRVKYNGLSKPYFYSEDGVVKDKRGQYNITLVGSAEDLSVWLEEMSSVRDEIIEDLNKQAGKKLKLSDNTPYEDEVDKETGEPTGNITIKLKHNALGIDPRSGKEWKTEPKVFDAKGQPVPYEVYAKLGRGSLVRCTFNAVGYVTSGKAGVKWELRATQILKPEWYEGASSGNDFEGQEVEDGFVVEEVTGEQEF